MDDSDYTTSNSNTVTLTAAANASDIISVVALQTDIPNSDYVPATGGTFSGDVTFDGSFTSQGIDDNATSTAMTLDNSGNLLVGGTSAGGSSTFTAYADGQIHAYRGTATGRAATFTATTSEVGYFNRLSTDGDVVQFAKDGTIVGSIGVGNANRPYIGGGDTGIMFDATNNAIYPWNPSTNNVPASDQVDLGYNATGVRFKDLYLSGGVVFGDAGGSGTSTSNTLDSYEEGTWTPVLTNYSGTYLFQVGTYTKVGNLVSFSFYLETGTAAGAGNITVGGLPFASASGSNRYHAYQGWGNSWDSNGAVQYLFGPNATYLNMYNVVTSGGVTSTTVADIGSNANIIISGTYTTDA